MHASSGTKSLKLLWVKKIHGSWANYKNDTLWNRCVYFVYMTLLLCVPSITFKCFMWISDSSSLLPCVHWDKKAAHTDSKKHEGLKGKNNVGLALDIACWNWKAVDRKRQHEGRNILPRSGLKQDNSNQQVMSIPLAKINLLPQDGTEDRETCLPHAGKSWKKENCLPASTCMHGPWKYAKMPLNPYGTDVTCLWHAIISHGDGCHKYVTRNFKYRRRMSHMCDRHNISLRCWLDHFVSFLKDYRQLLLHLLFSLLYSSAWQTASCRSYSHINKHGKTVQSQ